MATWNSRGLRGSLLEEMINMTNERYRESGLALIQKVPTPITPITIDKETRHITLAYFDQKSTVDYIGAVQGIPVCFDAKECAVDTFALQNIHPHQVAFMRDIMYYLSIRELNRFWDRMEQGGRKSFRFDELREAYFFSAKGGQMVPYLDMIQLELNERG